VPVERSVYSDVRPYPALQNARCLATLDVSVIAGGLGTRIQPVLVDTPKLLAPISGRPYLAYLLEWLSESCSAWDTGPKRWSIFSTVTDRLTRIKRS
jgi:molybdopterin-guanine dinucleotide biosynthesis protein A